MLVISQGMALIVVGGVLEEQGPASIGIIKIEHDIFSIVIQSEFHDPKLEMSVQVPFIFGLVFFSNLVLFMFMIFLC